MRTLLKEYAITVFALINEMYRLEAKDKLELIGITSIPHMHEADSRKIIESYQHASQRLIDLVTPQETDINALKQIFNG